MKNTGILCTILSTFSKSGIISGIDIFKTTTFKHVLFQSMLERCKVKEGSIQTVTSEMRLAEAYWYLSDAVPTVIPLRSTGACSNEATYLQSTSKSSLTLESSSRLLLPSSMKASGWANSLAGSFPSSLLLSLTSLYCNQGISPSSKDVCSLRQTFVRKEENKTSLSHLPHRTLQSLYLVHVIPSAGIKSVGHHCLSCSFKSLVLTILSNCFPHLQKCFNRK